MFNLESVGTLWRVPQSFAVLCPALLPPAVLQLVHHLDMVTVKVSASPEQIFGTHGHGHGQSHGHEDKQSGTVH